MELKPVRVVSAAMRALAVFGLFALAACAATPQQLAAERDQFCRNAGFVYGTPQYGQCILYAASLQQQRAIAAQDRQAAVGSALLGYSAATQSAPARVTHFTCTQQGVFTNCF